MNVLIAIMADSYEMVKEHEKVEALHERAKMIADMELLHPGWHRYSEYMHICEAADEDSALEPEWSGVAGRVKVLLSNANAELRSDMAKAEDVAAMKLEMAKAEEVAELRSDVALVKQDLSALAANMADMIRLLQQTTLAQETRQAPA